MLYSNYGVSNSPSFQGRFLSADVVSDAVKISKKAYLRGCQKMGVKIQQSELDSFAERGAQITEQLENVAAKLPENLDLALSKEKSFHGNKGLCLDFVHPTLGKVEVFGNPDYCRGANVRDFFGNTFHLGAVDTAVDGVFDMASEKLVNRFIAMQEGRITSEIKRNSVSLKKSRNKIDNLVDFTDKHTTDKAKYLKGRLDYKYGIEAQKFENKKSNRIFLLKNFFGLK